MEAKARIERDTSTKKTNNQCIMCKLFMIARFKIHLLPLTMKHPEDILDFTSQHRLLFWLSILQVITVAHVKFCSKKISVNVMHIGLLDGFLWGTCPHFCSYVLPSFFLELSIIKFQIL